MIKSHLYKLKLIVIIINRSLDTDDM